MVSRNIKRIEWSLGDYTSLGPLLPQDIWIAGIRIFYDGDGGIKTHGQKDTRDKAVVSLDLDPTQGEYISDVEIHCSKFASGVPLAQPRISYLRIKTNTNREKWLGKSSADHYYWKFHGSRLTSFIGTESAGETLNGLGAKFISANYHAKDRAESDNLTLSPIISEATHDSEIVARKEPSQDLQPLQWASESDPVSSGHIGGYGSYSWDLSPHGRQRLSVITVRCGSRVDSIQFDYQDPKDPEEQGHTPHFGKYGGVQPFPLYLQAGEYVTNIIVDVSKHGGSSRIGYLEIRLNTNVNPLVCGEKTGQTGSRNRISYADRLADTRVLGDNGQALLYLSGSSGDTIDGLDAHWIKTRYY